ncbi:MAG: hypothetical protein K2L45_06020, partial [Muribaculaceae bacterium]|nr:hypothetical protein [Muribaculaceae bacterium]
MRFDNIILDRVTLFEIIIIERKRGDKIADCIDIQYEIEPVAFDDMANRAPAESSAAIRERVIKARTIQNLRFKAEKGIYCNAQ